VNNTKKTMSVIHVVLFQFKADAKPEDVKAVRTTVDVDISSSDNVTR